MKTKLGSYAFITSAVLLLVSIPIVYIPFSLKFGWISTYSVTDALHKGTLPPLSIIGLAVFGLAILGFLVHLALYYTKEKGDK